MQGERRQPRDESELYQAAREQWNDGDIDRYVEVLFEAARAGYPKAATDIAGHAMRDEYGITVDAAMDLVVELESKPSIKASSPAIERAIEPQRNNTKPMPGGLHKAAYSSQIAANDDPCHDIKYPPGVKIK